MEIKTELLHEIKVDADEKLVGVNWNNPVVTSSSMFIDPSRIPVRCIILRGHSGNVNGHH